MPNSRAPLASAPRVMEFDVPPLRDAVNPEKDEAIVASLDIAPSAEWLAVFDEKVEALQCELGLAGVRIDGADIRFFATAQDARRLADRINALVQDVTIELMGRG